MPPNQMLSSLPSGRRHRLLLLLLLLFPLVSAAPAPLVAAHGEHSPACPFSTPAGSDHEDHHHLFDHDHDHDHHHLHDRQHEHRREIRSTMLPEELAEEEDLMLEGFDHDHHHHHDHHPHHPHHHDHHHHHHHHHSHGDHPSELSPIGMWVRAMGCSLLVSLASLICLAILPVILLQGKPSKSLVDSLAVFGAGAMLGDAFLHQLPHAFGGEHSHSHEHHEHHLEHGHSHAHSLEDLSVGLSILCGIVLFFLVEKVVRYVEDNSAKRAYEMGHGHHHHHKRHDKLKDENKNHDESNSKLDEPKDTLNDEHNGCQNDENHTKHETLLRKRATCSGAKNDDKEDLNAGNGLTTEKPSLNKTTQPSSLVFGYLNLFSDGVHNFTDGMALGSAFLLHGSVGGWSRTLFLLAHELPQEVGDFGILVRSGFSISKALFFNFLSALVALAGTALALVLGKDPGQSSLIEGFTAGGFIYIAVAGVLPEMNDGKTTFKGTAIQLTSLILGMAVALCISLVE